MTRLAALLPWACDSLALACAVMAVGMFLAAAWACL